MTIFHHWATRFVGLVWLLLSGSSVAWGQAPPAFCTPATDQGSFIFTTSFQNTPTLAAGTSYFWRINAVAGETYSFSNCVGTSGDTYLRVYDPAGSIVTSIDDNGPYCSGTPTSMNWQVPAGGSGVYFLHFSQYSCGPLSGATSLAYKSTLATPVGPPTISSLDPTSGAIGRTVTISGTNLGDVTGVTFNGVAASFTLGSVSEFTAVVPAGATTGPVVVTNASGTASASFTVLASPAISSFTPLSGLANSTVTITGTNLGGVTEVYFGGVPAQSFTIVSSATITAVVSAQASTGLISLGYGTTARASSSATFTVIQPNITRVEYFLDVDPGLGAGTSVPLTASPDVSSLAFSVGLSSLPAGFHRLSTRSRDANNVWSLTNTHSFYYEDLPTTPAALANINKVEYFLDNDPGLGNGVNVPVGAASTTASGLSFAVDLSALPAGFHRLSTRSRDANGVWSLTNTHSFYYENLPAAPPALANINKVEYFLDADPGLGNGINVPVGAPGTTLSGLSFAVDLTTLPAGFHRLSTRSRDVNGVWSLTNTRSFYYENLPATPPTLANINRVEYFIDAEPGLGNGVNVPIATPGTNVSGLSFAVDLSALPAGFHRLTTRSRDVNGVWSISNTRSFYYENLPVTPPALANINKVEYFFDTDPGFGLATNVPVATPAPDLANLSLIADASALPDGVHRLFVRSRDANGKWSLVLNRSFTKYGCGSSTNLAANLPTASYTGSGLGTTVAQSVFNNTGFTTGPSAFQNNNYVQADLGAAPQTVSDVHLHLRNVNGTAVNYTLQVEVSSDLNNWTVAESYASTLAANQSSPVLVARTFGTVQNNVRGLRLRLLLPALSQGIQVTNAGVFYFNCTGPTITSFNPLSGPVGTSVSIVGTNLGGTTQVYFNNTLAPGYVVNGAGTGITVSVPTGATTGIIRVITPAGTGYSDTNFTVTLPVPTVASFTPNSGPINTPVTLTGTNFSTATSVRFNGTPAAFTINSATSISTTVPNGSTTGPITVTAPGGTGTSATDFVVIPAPVITSFSPGTGGTGTPVTLFGSNFQNTSAVRFNGTLAPGFSVNGAGTQVTVAVPAGAASGPITLVTPGGTATSTSSFTVLNPPAIASLNPLSGPAGTSVTVTGQNLTAATAVTFNGTAAASFTVNSATQLTAIVPAGASTGLVRVTTAGGTASSPSNFTVVPTTLAAQAAVCVNAGSFALAGGSPAGGTYSGPGVSSGQFNPATAGTGTHTITYTYALNGVTTTATQPLTVRALPTVTLAAQAPRCQGAAAFALTGGSPAGGAYSGPGVSSGQFNATAAGVGTHTITYSYTDGNGCTSVATQPLTVLPTPTFASSATTVCTGQPVTLTVSNAGPGATYVWSPGGATTASITPSPTATTTYSVTVTNAAGCTYPFSQAVTVNPYTSAPGVVGQLQPVDNSNGLSLPINFSWSPASSATAYDLYVWSVNDAQPATPTVSGINSLQYSFNGPLPYGAQYRWRVVARNPCFSTPGPVLAFGLRELPDLRVSFIQNPDTVYAGQTMTMSWNVTNKGTGSTLAQQWQDYVWLSQDSVFNASTAIPVGAWGNTTFLQPNATYITNATFRVPYSEAGYYYVFVRANSNQYAGNGPLLETDYANNRRLAGKRTLMIVPQTPDFSLENFVSPPDLAAGYTNVTMRYRVYNRGAVSVTAPRYDEFFISPDTIQNISQNTGRGALGPNAISLGRQRVTDTLLTNGYYARTVQVRIPHTEFGTRYFYVYSDTDNQIFETASTNNVNRPQAVEVILRPPADLVPIALNAPANMLAGTSATVTWDVRNNGNNAPVAEERYWGDQFWLSKTATFDPATAIAVGNLSVFGGDTLAAHHHYRRSVTLNIPNGLSGTYYVFGQADYVGNSTRGNVFEYDKEGNNMLRSGVVNVTLAYADLQPTAFTGPATVDAFETFTVNYTVRNNSGAVGPANGTWVDAVWLVTPGGSVPGSSLNCLSPIAQTSHAGPLAPGATYNGSITLAIPRYIEPGTYDLVLHTDNGNVVYEYNFEGNNERRYTFTYRYSDDLRLTALSTTGAAYSGQTIGVNFSVDNQGAFRTLATGWRDEFYLSTDATLDGSDLLLTAVTRDAELAVGGSYNGTATVRLPHGLQGNFYVLGKAGVRDGRGYCTGGISNVLTDTDPANNFRTTAVRITLTPPCDLIPTAYTLPDDVVAGQEVTIPFTIKNQSTGATLEGSWDDGIYLSTSPSINGAMVRIGTYRHPGTLGAGQSYTGSVTAKIPAYLSGNYYIFLVTDISPSYLGYYPVQLWGGAVQYGTVYEHQQELNNVVQGSILIRVPQPADLVVTSVTVPASRKLGEVMTVHYQVKNQGVNPAVGQLKDGLYLSKDATVDGAEDQLFASKTQNITIQPNQTVNGVVRSHLQGIAPGTYKGLMATNLFDDIYEGGVSSPAANNNVTEAGNPLNLGVNVLALKSPTSFPLMLDSVVYYKVTPGADKDMVLTLTSDRSFGQNEMYVAYNRVPTPADYDFIYLNQVSTSQEILVPTTGAGDYYVLVKTPYQYPGLQTATLYADNLDFQVRSITANRVGRGRVTTQVLGAAFRRRRTGTGGYPATRFFLTQGADPAIVAEAQVLTFRNSTEVTLRWHLDDVPVGVYNVVADNNGTRVQLTNGLTVEPARPLNVDFATIIPQTVRVGTNANWTYFLQNNSNVDVPYWEFQYELPPGQNPVITHTPNVRKKSDFHAGAGSATPRNRLDDGLTEVLPFVARDLRPGEIIQVNLRLTPNRLGGLPVVWNQAALTEEWYTRQTLDHISNYRAVVLAAPASFPAGVATLAANATAWQDSLRRYYVRNGLLDTAALRAGHLRTGYTAKSSTIAIPGGICGDWGITECVRPFRPNPFDANSYPAALVGCADSIVFTYKGRGASCTQIVGSADPNLIAGPDGVGKRKMVGVQQRLSYQVQFENDPVLATAPAQVVRVTVPLSTAFDPQQFRLGSFGWADRTFQVPADLSSYTSLLDMPDSLGYDVRVLGTVDVVGRRLVWLFETIDPATGVAPEDPNKGFLLLNDSTGRGQGFVNYTIKASPTAATGDTLAAQATIVFDTNPPLATNRWKNVLDAGAPTSHVAALPANQPGATVALHWTAADDAGGSGLRSYDLYASRDGEAFERVAADLNTTSYDFTGVLGSRYEFFTLATDTTGNQEALKQVAEATTTLAEPVLLVWTGATSTAWNTATNWTGNVVPTATNSVRIPADAPRFPVVNSPAQAFNLTLDTGADLTVAGSTLDVKGTWTANGHLIQTGGVISLSGTSPQVLTGASTTTTTFRNLSIGSAGVSLSGGPVKVQQVLTLNGDLTTNGRSLTLLSDASGTALIVNAGGVVVGMGTMQRYLDASANTGVSGYRHYSAPVSNTTVADLTVPGVFTPTVNGAYNSAADPARLRPFPTVIGYDQNRISTVTSTYGPFDRGFFSPSSLSDALEVGRGYAVQMPNAGFVDFQGTFNNAPAGAELVRTDLRRSAEADAGWHLLGNPFPSPLDWTSMTTSGASPNLENMGAAVYVFRSSGPYTGNYVYYVNGEGDLTDGIVPAGQGFFVRTNPGTVGAVRFRNANRVTTFGSQPVFGRGTAQTHARVSLEVGNGTLADKTVVYFEAGASAAFDPLADAYKLANSTGLSLGTVAGSDWLALNGLPLLGNQLVVVPMRLAVPKAGTYAFTAGAVENFAAGSKLWLRDAQTGTRTALSTGTRYSFSTDATWMPDRFTLEVLGAEVLATSPQNLAAQVQLYPNPVSAKDGSSVTISVPMTGKATATSATVLNALGQVVAKLPLPVRAGVATGTISTTGLASGVYVVRLQTGDVTVSKRLVVE
jgi:hypothetical protein